MALKDGRFLGVTMGGGEGKAPSLCSVHLPPGTEQDAVNLEGSHFGAGVGIVDTAGGTMWNNVVSEHYKNY